MTPIKWDSSLNEIETTENDPDWYNYTEKQWANAKTLDGSYWVWIPRYAYKITSGYHLSDTGTIDIKFLKGISNINEEDIPIETNNYIAHVKDTSMHYFLHPAFQFNGEESGFWVAKFEPTAKEGVSTLSGSCLGSPDNVSTKTIKVVPNATSWRCMQISNIFQASSNMKNQSVYGWKAEEVDPHMMINLEWGAVTYLSKSPFGVNGEKIWPNSSNLFRTGCSASSVNSENESACFAYNTTNGVKASTTHNIYGIYDMSGGSWEYVSAYINNGDSNLTRGNNILAADSKYKNIYSVGTTDDATFNYFENSNKYGNAVYEISGQGYGTGGWENNHSIMPNISNPWFVRGGRFLYNSEAGIFTFYGNTGASPANSNYTFRVTIFAQ